MEERGERGAGPWDTGGQGPNKTAEKMDRRRGREKGGGREGGEREDGRQSGGVRVGFW